LFELLVLTRAHITPNQTSRSTERTARLRAQGGSKLPHSKALTRGQRLEIDPENPGWR
jgi:hypothetical protein